MPHVSIVVHGEEAPSDRRIDGIAKFLGLQATVINLSNVPSADLGRQSTGCLIVSAQSLSAILADPAISPAFVGELFDRTPFVLLYGITGDKTHFAAVNSVTDGLLSTVTPFESSNHSYQVSSEHRDLTGEFTGLTFSPINVQSDHAMVVKEPRSGFSSIVSINGRAFFGRLQRRSSSLFLLGCSEIADLHAAIERSLTARKYFSHLMPIMMFLRRVFPKQTWHNPRRFANLIIDDPLLRQSYGYLNYFRLLETMDEAGFSSTVAFIPWNYKRTDPAVARIVRQRSDKLHLCVHGCDHTGGEFATKNSAELDRLVHLASQRMDVHQQLTAVPYAKVMVFPQGRFSSVSLAVLKKHNYLAAVNDSVVPEDIGQAHGLTVEDLLSPAMCKYSSFPLFNRRYPRDVVDLAFDLFVGKPALLLEHHDYFKKGYTDAATFAKTVNALSPALQWSSLEEIVKNTYLQRTASPDVVECKIFANRQVIRNLAPAPKTFLIRKTDHYSSAAVKSLEINGKTYPHDIRDGEIQFSIDIPASSAVELRIDYLNDTEYPATSRNRLGREVKIYVRRYLSEVRDNYISKNEGLLSLANRIVRNMGTAA